MLTSEFLSQLFVLHIDPGLWSTAVLTLKIMAIVPASMKKRGRTGVLSAHRPAHLPRLSATLDLSLTPSRAQQQGDDSISSQPSPTREWEYRGSGFVAPTENNTAGQNGTGSGGHATSQNMLLASMTTRVTQLPGWLVRMVLYRGHLGPEVRRDSRPAEALSVFVFPLVHTVQSCHCSIKRLRIVFVPGVARIAQFSGN